MVIITVKLFSKQNITLLKLKRAEYMCKPWLKKGKFYENIKDTEPEQNVQIDTLFMIYQTIL